MDSADAPMLSDLVDGVIPHSFGGPQVQSPSPLISFPSRSEIIREAISICSQHASLGSLEAKVDTMTSLVGKMLQLLLVEHNSTSPLTWATGSSNTSGASAALCSSSSVKSRQLFKCPVCPRSKPPLTEKGFHKHVLSWKSKARGLGRKKPNSCPGILAAVEKRGGDADRVDSVVNTALSMMNRGSNAAHGEGTGNHVRMENYFHDLMITE